MSVNKQIQPPKFLEDEDVKFATRGCDIANLDTGCIEETSGGYKGSKCICDSNLCNSAQQHGFNMVLGVTAAFAVMTFL